jgi:hypothetical protein
VDKCGDYEHDDEDNSSRCRRLVAEEDERFGHFRGQGLGMRAWDIPIRMKGTKKEKGSK